MEINIFSGECRRCGRICSIVDSAVNELGVEAYIKRIPGAAAMLEEGVLSSPTLQVNGKVKARGRIPGKETVKRWLQEEAGL